MNREEARKKAQALVAQMTIEEKASQLRYDAPAIERLGVPAYNWWNEGLHGVARAGTATVFPQAIALGATFDEELLGLIADVVATEGRAKYNEYSKHNDRDIYKGLTFWSPNVNIFRDPRWGRGHETYGEDPFLTSKLGVSFVKGLQGDGETMKAAACAKHFAVHSGPEAIRHEFDVHPSKKDREETYLPAFEALVKEADVESVMGAYNRVDGEPACGSQTLLKEILRDKWGFKGHVVSDCWAIRDFHETHKVTNNPKESVAMALNAGCDLNCGCTYLCIMAALQDGLIKEEQVTEAAVRLFTTRYLLGLFDGSEYDNIPYEVVECDEHIALASRAAKESIVMLKNDGILPLSEDKVKTIGVIGPNANSRVALIGNYHGTSSEYVTVLEGIQEQVRGKARVLYSEGCALFKDKTEPLAWDDDRLSEAKTVAEHSDIVVLCVGLDETLEGEEGDTGNSYASGDKTDLLLPECQRKLMKAVAETGKPVILCLQAGSSIDLSYAYDNFNGVLQLWYPGARGGRDVADIIFGQASPSGKLPITFYNTVEELPEFTDYTMKGRTYRYMENAAQFSFGYGLTYGDIRVKSATVKDNSITAGEDGKLTLIVDIVNDGKCATEDVVQLYIKNLDSVNAVTNHSLCGFKRVKLGAGEKATIEIVVDYNAFTVFTEDGERIQEGKKFEIYAATFQPDERSIELMGYEPVKVAISL